MAGPGAGGSGIDPATPSPSGVPGSAEGAPPPRRGARRPGAVYAVAVTGPLVLAASAVAVVLALHRPRPAPPVHSLRGMVFGLRAGQCLNSAPNGIDAAHAVPCRQPHDAEIYATYRLAARRWPGAGALGRQARQGCLARLGGYLNPQLAPAGLTQSYIYPGQGAWEVGERTVVCEVRSSEGKLTGSVRASGGLSVSSGI